MTARRNSRLTLLSLLLGLALLAAACGGAAEADPAAEASDTPTTESGGEVEAADDGAAAENGSESADEVATDAGDWQAGAGQEWEEVLAAGQEEGTVVVAGFPFLAEPMAEAFLRDTGIQLEWLGGDGSELSARLAQEAAAGNVSVDLQLGVGSDPWTLYPQGYLQELEPQLLLPGVTEPENWRDGSIRWMDPDQAYFIQPAEYVHGWAIVNSDFVDPSELQEWEDLLDPKYKGMIASSDPTVPGPGQGAANYMQVEYGIDFVTDLFINQEVEYTQDTSQLIEWAARGTYPIVLGGIQSTVERFKAEGFPLEPALPGYLTGGFSPIKQVKGVPHPNAATVFLNWYLSEPGQTVYASVLSEQTLRTDVEVEAVPDYVDPALYPHADFNGYDWDYYVDQRSDLLEVLVERLEGGR